MTLTDAALARRRLEAALAMGTKPTLSSTDVDDLLMQAASTDADGNTVYTGEALNAAAASGWAQKAGMTSDQYDMGGGPGKTLDRSQWQATCERLAEKYSMGRLNVLATVTRRRGIGSVGLTTSLAVESEGVL